MEQPTRIFPPFSVSKIKLCDNCRYAAYMKYCKKLPEEYNQITSCGKIAHWGLEQYGKYCRERRLEHAPEYTNTLISVMRGKMTLDEWDAIEWPFRKFIRKLRFPTVSQIGIEWDGAVDREWSVTGFDDPNAWFRAKIDYMFLKDQETMEIWDYKTGYKVHALKSPAVMFQLRSYGAIVKAFFPAIKKVILKLVYLRYDIVLEETMDLDRLDDAKMHINDKISDIMADVTYEARIQDYCRLCSYAGSCPAFQRYKSDINFDKVTNDVEAQLMATKLYTTKQLIKLWHRELKAYVERQGNEIPVGKDLVFGCKVTPKENVHKVKEMLDFVKEIGVPEEDVWRNITLPKATVGRLLEKAGRADLKDTVLSMFGKKSASNEWGILEVGSDEDEE